MTEPSNRSTWRIPGMDCPSEEQLIRMKLSGLEQIQQLRFDLEGRRLSVLHSGPSEPIDQRLVSLNMGAALESSDTVIPDEAVDQEHTQRSLLWTVLIINAFFFLAEGMAGFLSGSVGLVADGLDMLADALVYGLALWAVGAAAVRKKNVARVAGVFQGLLALGGMAEVIMRYLHPEDEPGHWVMVAVSVFALVGNAACLYLLRKGNSAEAHIRASVIFTANDVLANLGVIAAGIAGVLLQSAIPDLVIGFIIFLLVARGSWQIFSLSR